VMVAQRSPTFDVRPVVEDELLPVGVVLTVEMQGPRAPRLCCAREVVASLESLGKLPGGGALHGAFQLAVHLDRVAECRPVLALQGTTDRARLPIGNGEAAGLAEGGLAVPAMDGDRGSVGRHRRSRSWPRAHDVALHVLVMLGAAVPHAPTTLGEIDGDDVGRGVGAPRPLARCGYLRLPVHMSVLASDKGSVSEASCYPAGMSDELLALGVETEQVLRQGPVHDRAPLAGRSLVWAAFNLRAARIGRRFTELLCQPRGLDELEALLQEGQANVFEVAAMSLGFGDVMSALDLCGSALDAMSNASPPALDKRGADMGDWFSDPSKSKSKRAQEFHSRRQQLPSEVQAWLDHLEAHPDWDLLKTCRDPIVHRLFPRALIASSVNTGLTLAKIDLTLAGNTDPRTADPAQLRDISDLILKVLSFGEDQYRTFCKALKAAYG